MEDEWCPLWAADGSAETVDGSFFGIYDASAPLLKVCQIHRASLIDDQSTVLNFWFILGAPPQTTRNR